MVKSPAVQAGDEGVETGHYQSQGSTAMTQLRLISNESSSSQDPLTLEQRQILEGALAKIVLIGEQVGVSADQMIKLLDAGMTVRELLEFIAARGEEIDLRKRMV